MSRTKRAGWMILGMLLLISCSRDTLFVQNVPLDPDGWRADQFIRFDVPVQDTYGSYSIYLQVRNDGRYENSNLWLFVTTHSPTGATLRDTIEIRLADEEGRWLGRGAGGRYSLQIPYRFTVRFPEAGNYLFEIEQGMRTQLLRYITDIGLRIEKAG